MLIEKLLMKQYMPKRVLLLVMALLFGMLVSLSSFTSVEALNVKTKNIRYDTNGYIQGDIVYTEADDGGDNRILIDASFDFAHEGGNFESLNLRVSDSDENYQEDGYTVSIDENVVSISHLQVTCFNIAQDGNSAFVAGQAVDTDNAEIEGKWFLIQLIDYGIDGDELYWSMPKWNNSEEIVQTCQDGSANPVTEGWNRYDTYAYTEDGQTRVDAINILPDPEYRQRITVNADNQNGGSIHWENLDSQEEHWYKMELSCVNVIGGNQGAFIAGQITQYSTALAGSGYEDTWQVFQFIDEEQDSIYSYQTQETNLTEAQANAYCENGALNVEEEWELGAPKTILDGDIVITPPTYLDKTYQIDEELALIADRGELDIGCSDKVYTLVDGEFHKYYKETYTPNREAFEAGEPDAKMRISVINKYTGDWAHGSGGVSEEGSELFNLANGTALIVTAVFSTDGSMKADFSWSGDFVNQSTGETEDWFNGDFKIKNGEIQNGVVEGTCNLM